MPKRRRNPDGSLVTPLSEKQLANLAKGREKLLAKASGGALQGEGDREGRPARPGRQAERVALESTGQRKRKTTGQRKRQAKASTGQRKTRSRSQAKASTGERTGQRGFVDRAIDWFGST